MKKMSTATKKGIFWVALVVLIVVGIVWACSVADANTPAETTTSGTTTAETTTAETTTTETTTADTTTAEVTTPEETTTAETTTADTTTAEVTTPEETTTETTTDTTPVVAHKGTLKKVLEVGTYPNGSHLVRIEELTGLNAACEGTDCPYCALRNGQINTVYVHVDGETLTICDGSCQ